MTAAVAALVLVVAGLLAGCGAQEVAPPASSCTGERADVVAALAAAPARVELPDGATISACVRRARSDADLQNVGVTLSGAAEDLEERALAGDARAAVGLGYLVGAARTGARTTSGVSAELVNRLERSAAVAGAGRAIEAAVARGLAAGERRG